MIYANQHLSSARRTFTMLIMHKRNVSTVLRELLDRHGISPTELHRRTGVPQSTLSRILSGKIADPSDKHISRIAEYFRVSTDQLRGRGDAAPGKGAVREGPHSELKDISLWDDDTPIDDDEVSIPFLREVELAAGSGRFVIEESEKASLRFGKRSLRHNGVQFDQAKCVTVRGNSMLPVLRDGATVGVNAGKCGIGDIVDGDLYAINHNGQLRVKQLYRLPSGIRLRSFNRDEHPDEDYSFQEIQEEQIIILGHVFWWGMYAR
ncbi:HTH-type transcriptional regulator PrtR [Pseudomonas fluorescens]|uniref:HTH-type transcriptional regulator PrtR n=2 Tax=Pseudomonas fluorescens TaxID=294 RepID=A0A5E7BS73_PSEFL|nr:HTH-type transcriptional regulator PrtR [Pseudomonas fluorescens]